MCPLLIFFSFERLTGEHTIIVMLTPLFLFNDYHDNNPLPIALQKKKEN
jgi:hypothetical protein